MAMKLSRLLAALPRFHRSGSADPNITHITADSRRVETGGLFVAYQGVSVDGHRFIGQAIERGAAAIVAEKPVDTALPVAVVPDGREALAYLAAAWHHFPARRLITVGITGTDGKTTITNFLYHMLQAAGRPTGMINTVNARIGPEILETGLHTTTPDAPDVQRFLARMVEAGIEICLLEATSHGLAQHRVTACDFDVAIVSNITHEHLDLHGSLEAYRAAKASLFESLAAAADKSASLRGGKRFLKGAVLNCDDWSFAYLRDRLGGTLWLGYSLADHPQASLTARHIICRPDRTAFTIDGPGYSFETETSLIGDYNVANCLAAATAALELLAVSPQAVQAGIAALPGIPGRMERIDEGQPFLAVVDFAHTPNALRRSLQVARSLVSGRVIAVFGAAGQRDVEKRTMMGRLAAELADIAIITLEDPRTESYQATMTPIIQAIEAAGGRFEPVFDRGRAIYRAVALARPGDIVIALGKGHEQSMCFGEIEYPWDDRQAMRSALRGQPLLTLPSASLMEG